MTNSFLGKPFPIKHFHFFSFPSQLFCWSTPFSLVRAPIPVTSGSQHTPGLFLPVLTFLSCILEFLSPHNAQSAQQKIRHFISIANQKISRSFTSPCQEVIMWVACQRNSEDSISIFLYKDTFHLCSEAIGLYDFTVHIIQINVGLPFGSTTELFTDS
ncbi:hypothetical protein EPI10_022147 [Gossypium australe]|uniref:Uncharacterized protein n=1 Tax=Gossypium australe TaxID=47621 RepID=A0A5B6WLS7_9ROSI|nr:hypothetical protein EPI10_022147 [Gossypium australe]